MIFRKSLAINQDSCCNFKTIKDFLINTRIFQGAEVNQEDLIKELRQKNKLKELFELLESYDRSLTSLFSLKNFSLCSDGEFKSEILSRFKEMMDVCYHLECELILMEPSFIDLEDYVDKPPQWRIFQRTTKRLLTLAKMAWKQDILIGLEFNSSGYSTIKNLENAREVLNPLRSQVNIGYIIDLFHFLKSESKKENLKEINDYIFLVQLCDFNLERDWIPTDLKEEDRNFPGQGNYNLKDFVSLLKKNRYNGKISVEAFKKECDMKLLKKVQNTILKY